MQSTTAFTIGLMALLAACAPTTGPLGPDANSVQSPRPTPAFLATGKCTWRGSAYRCPEGEPVTIQVRRDDDASALMWETCPNGYDIRDAADVPIGSTSVSSTYKSGGVLDPAGPLLGRSSNTYTETQLVTERRITFACRNRPTQPETEIVCGSADVRSCVRRATTAAR